MTTLTQLTDVIASGVAIPPSRIHVAPVVHLPTSTVPTYEQTLIGTTSAYVADIEEFRGIPYGNVPGRWQHSVMRTHLPTDVFDASRNGCRCSQPPEPNNTATFQSYLEFPLDVLESEFDCLNLFITRPSKASLMRAGLGNQAGGLPIYFYIHGGAYAFGAGTDPMWDPARLVARSVTLGKPFIAVHVNYRLNLFGFAASSDILNAQSDSAKGFNFGLTDQRTALEWVSRNIAAFGGDFQRITVGGQSAGASSAHAHVLNARASQGRPLIQKAIIQSAAVGTLGPLSLAEAEARWHWLCRYFGVEQLSSEQRMAKLMAVSDRELLAAVRQAEWDVFPLVEDGLTLTSNACHQYSLDLELNNKRNDDNDCNDDLGKRSIHVLIGDTDLEGSVFFGVVSSMVHYEQIENFVRQSLISPTITSEILRAYNIHAAQEASELQAGIYDFLTDVEFGIPVERARQDLSVPATFDSHTSQRIQVSSYRIQFGNPFPGDWYDIAQHCVDLIYIYDCFHDHLRMMDQTLDASVGVESTHSALVQQLQSQWIEFITSDTKEDDVGAIGRGGDLLINYGKDRRLRYSKISENQDSIARKKRFDILERSWPDALKLAQAILVKPT